MFGRACPSLSAYFGRNAFRSTSLSPDHVESMAHTFVSTHPVGRTTSRTTSWVMSVGTIELFFGHATQSTPSGGRDARKRPRRVSRSLRRLDERDDELDRLSCPKSGPGGHPFWERPEGLGEAARGAEEGDRHPGLDPELLQQRRPGVAGGEGASDSAHDGTDPGRRRAGEPTRSVIDEKVPMIVLRSDP